MRVATTVVCVCVFALVGGVRAEPLLLEQIPAGAKWVTHVDIDAARGSAMVGNGLLECKTLAEESNEECQIAGQLVNLVSDLRAITLFGTRFEKEACVAIFRMNFTNAQRVAMIQRGRQMPDCSNRFHGMCELLTWTHAKGTASERSITTTYVRPDRVLVAALAAEITATLDVIDEVESSVVDHSSPLTAESPAGAILLVRAITPSTNIGLPAITPLLKQAEAVSLAIGETDREGYANVEFLVKDAQTAKNISASIKEGLTAMSRRIGDEELVGILKNVKIAATDKAVTARASIPVVAGWRHLKRIAALMAEERQEHMDKPENGQGE